MTETKGRPAGEPGGQSKRGRRCDQRTAPLASQQVAWWPVHEFLEGAVAQANCAGPLPWPGTPAWCVLSDNDPAKLLALAEFGEHHAMRVETSQAALAESSRDVSAAADWSQIAREVQQRQAAEGSGAYIRRLTA